MIKYILCKIGKINIKTNKMCAEKIVYRKGEKKMKLKNKINIKLIILKNMFFMDRLCPVFVCESQRI